MSIFKYLPRLYLLSDVMLHWKLEVLSKFQLKNLLEWRFMWSLFSSHLLASLSDVMLHRKLKVHSKLQLWWNACMHQLVDTKSSFWKMRLTSQSENLPSVVFLNDKNWQSKQSLHFERCWAPLVQSESCCISCVFEWWKLCSNSVVLSILEKQKLQASVKVPSLWRGNEVSSNEHHSHSHFEEVILKKWEEIKCCEIKSCCKPFLVLNQAV